MKRARVHKPRTGRRYDADYERKRNADPQLREAARFRSSIRWQRFRAWFIARQPLCVNPYHLHDGQERATQEVHHIEPVARRPDLALLEENCMATCTECHAAASARERANANVRRN